MPTYVYRRPDGTTFEAFQKISDPALTADPESGEPVERVISGGAGLQFKGSGFYLTDYVHKGRPSSNESGGGESGGGSKDSAASGSTGDAKSGSKAESASPAKTETPAPTKSDG